MACSMLVALAGLRRVPLVAGSWSGEKAGAPDLLAAGAEGSVASDEKARSGVAPSGHRRLDRVREALTDLTAGARQSSEAMGHSPGTLLLLALDGFSFFVVGALEMVIVVLAARVLHPGLSGAGYLAAGLGAGSLLAGAVTMTLVGRPRLARVLAVAMIGVGTAIGLLGLVPRTDDAFVLIGSAGLGVTVFDVTTRTLLQRAAHSDSIARAFALLEAITSVGLGLGAVFARAVIALGGDRAALLALAGLTLILVAVSWRRLRAIDAAAKVPQVEVQLLRSISIFAGLPAPELESLAGQLVREHVQAGTTVIAEGDPGDRYYAVAEGCLSVTKGDAELARLSRGDGFGEIALVHDVQRTATVSALTDTTLYSLGKASFEGVLGRFGRARETAQAIATRLQLR